MVLSFSIFFLLSSKKEFSENENRYLAKMPDLTFSNIKSGRFVSELETFITDSFPLRDFLVGLKTRVEKIVGKKDINDIYLGKDDFMLTRYQKIDTSKLINLLNDFQTKNRESNINLMIVPSSISIYDDKLPSYAITDSEIDVINEIYNKVSIPSINVYNTLLKLKETDQVFYKTDHHWTTIGAYYAYLEFCKKNNITPKNINYFDIVKVNDFYGTLYSKTNNYKVSSDTISLFKTKTNFLVQYLDNKKESNTLYDDTYLNSKDKYSIFLSNNHSLLTITNLDIVNNDEILVIKDSYGNSFIPFLAEHYKKVHVVDLRYNLNSMTDYLKKNNINNVLILYNINTINDESSIYYLR